MTGPIRGTSNRHGTVVIDAFASGAVAHRDDHLIVAIDVIRATTLAVTAVALGRRCLLATSPEDAHRLRDELGDAVLAGELAGDMPAGFDMNNSPADLAERDDAERPLVMLSSSGTELMLAAGLGSHGALAACLRNLSAVADHLIARPQRVAVIGAGSRGEFREEDQLACAWLADRLLGAGFGVEDEATCELIERWRGAPVAQIEQSNSVAYLRRSGQMRDYDFTIGHVDDLTAVCEIDGNELRSIAS